MLRRILAVVGLLALALTAWLAFVLVAMRTKSPRMLGAVRRFNRDVTNRAQYRLAGKPGAWASLIRHRGRTSGRMYETPIVPFATDGGFLVALPYGPEADWVKNVLAAGSAELVTGGETLAVNAPQVVTTESVKDMLPENEQRTHRVFRVEQCLRLARASV